MFLEQATTQPLSFYEVLDCKSGERVALRDVLIGGETEVIEHLGSQSLRPGDMVYAQVWNLPGLATFGCSAPTRIPPSHKAEIIGPRKKLRQRAAKRNRTLSAEDLLRYASDVRETYLDVRDALHTPPVFCNTDGDLLLFHTLTFKIESAEAVFEALWPLAFGRRKEELLERAKTDPAGNLLSIEFEWMKKGNRKMPDWDNTILRRIKISGNSLVAEVNSENRASLFLRTVEKRLGAQATHQSTIVRTLEELRMELRKGKAGGEDWDDDFLRDPEVRKEAQELLRKQMEGWVHRKIPILDGRTPMEAVQDPDGREIVESLLRDQELSAEEEALRRGFQQNINAVRKVLGLAPSAS